MTVGGNTYYYERNGQGDVIALVDTTGNEVVKYSYDTWGKVQSVTGTLASTVGQLNPFRYRGYYYDTETGLYYLQSRYYDPCTGRFINSDGAVSTGTGLLGFNMFSYCNNNPVSMADDGGSRPMGINPDRETPEERKQSFASQAVVRHKEAARAALDEGIGFTINAAEGFGDAFIEKAINESSTVEQNIGNAATVLTPALRYGLETGETSIIKSVSKSMGLIGAAGYVWDICSDAVTYHGNDFTIAAAIDMGGTLFCIGAGVVFACMNAPVVAAVLAGVCVSGFVNAGGNIAKKALIGY